ncbi:MAG: flavodoxin [Succinivibrio sp.]|nr:flavodoxin [Succinivibrio sp.]
MFATGSAQAKSLVVYYSESGYTKNVANTIAKHLNGDTFELIPAEPYSGADLDYNNPSSRVSREHDNPNRVVKLRENRVSGFADYDTVFVAYPIWWGIAAWPVDDFVRNNDFDGKKVIPVATSFSSPLGQSGILLKDMAQSGDWQEGIRFSSGVDEKTVTEWLDSLNLK